MTVNTVLPIENPIPVLLEIIDKLSAVAKAAHNLCDSSPENAQTGEFTADIPSFHALNDALDELDTIPEIDDGYVRDGWLLAKETLHQALEQAKVTAYGIKFDDGTLSQLSFKEAQAREYAEIWNSSTTGNKAHVFNLFSFEGYDWPAYFRSVVGLNVNV